MKILINMATLKMGGGQNVGLNFLKGLETLDYLQHEFFFVVAKDSLIHDYISKKYTTDNYMIVSNNPYIRIIQEKIYVNKYIISKGINIIYTYFGFGNFNKKNIQVMGVADSNLFYPEINFWSEYGVLKRISKKIIDNYRLKGYKSANGLIFENIDMEKRYKFRMNGANRTTYIQPSILTFDNEEDFSQNDIRNNPKGLFLCGWQLNKNIFIIPELVRKALDKGCHLHITITAPLDNSKYHKKFLKLCNEYKVKDYISIIGTVKKSELNNLYKNIDFVFLLSKLESFSNNIIESWHYKRPIVISDLDWAKSICKNAAIYVKRDSTDDIIEKILVYINDNKKYKAIVENGSELIKTYPNYIEKTLLEIKFLEDVYNNAI